MFAQINGSTCPFINPAGRAGHVERVEGGIVVGIHPTGFHPSPEGLVCTVIASCIVDTLHKQPNTHDFLYAALAFAGHWRSLDSTGGAL